MKELVSLQNPLVKHLVKLRVEREYRYAQQRVMVCGLKCVQELSTLLGLRTVFVEKGSQVQVRADEVFFVTPEILKKVTGLASPEPIAAELDMPRQGDLSVVEYLLILDGVSDPGNLGTLLRTARALGWEGVYVTEGSTDPYHERALRSAKGATFTLPWKSGPLEEVIDLVKQRKMRLLVADVSGKEVNALEVAAPVALVLGNEAHGVSERMRGMGEEVAIPMAGRMESLNVAAAGAILMYALGKK